MASIVEIKETRTSLTVNVGDDETLFFDVVNTTDAPLEIGLSIAGATSDDTPPGWVSVKNADGITLRPAETRRIEVQLRPTAEAGIGKNRFRLLVFDKNDARERFQHSETISVATNGTAPAPDPSPNKWALVIGIAAAAVLLIGGGIIAWIVFGSDKMPDLRGRTLTEAEAELREFGITPTTEPSVAPDKPQGTVIDQDPPPNESLSSNTPVTLSIAAAPKTMPILIGESQHRAAMQLLERGVNWRVDNVERQENQRVGEIVSTTPAAGEVLRSDTNVIIEVAREVMPQLKGKTVSQARLELSKVGVDNPDVREVEAGPGQRPNTVIDQEPSGATYLVGDMTIRIDVTGQQRMPPLIGMTVEQQHAIALEDCPTEESLSKKYQSRATPHSTRSSRHCLMLGLSSTQMTLSF